MSDVTICYGMTETSPVSFQSETDDSIDRRVATVGAIHPHTECKIIDPETGAIVAHGERGELCTRGYLVMLGYWNDPGATRAVLDPARWMHTGDLATMREDGYVNIVGRLKDMIIRGGENISPKEIEIVLHQDTAVLEAAVIGGPSDVYGEVPVAFVAPKPGATITIDRLLAACRENLTKVKVPVDVVVLDTLPKNPVGKIDKPALRTQYAKSASIAQGA